MNIDLLYLNRCKLKHSDNFGESELVRDLKMDIILDAMSDNDVFLKTLCKKLLLHPSNDLSEINMRQEIMQEAINHPEFFVSLYYTASDDLSKTFSYKELTHPRYNKIVTISNKVITHIELANLHVTYLELIREKINLFKGSLSCALLQKFCTDILEKYTNDYIAGVKNLLIELSCLKVNSELEIGGHLSTGFKLADIILHTISKSHNSLLKNLKYDAVIMLDNIVLINNAQEIADSGLVWLLKTLSDFNHECSLFFEEIQEILGFYVGAINLYKKVISKGVAICFPSFSERNEFNFSNLTDAGLVLKNQTSVVGNTFYFSNKTLCIITGTNQGGKTTFLRSIGLAQLMSQCGLFVTAAIFESQIFNGVYTHFPNEEDRGLNNGLLEQELYRLNKMVPYLQPGSLLLMNETFSTTTEYDASILAEHITSALNKCNITIFFVTHLFEYAHKLYTARLDNCIFYRACRMPDGTRTFQLEEGEPLRSSFAFDLYHQIID